MTAAAVPAAVRPSAGRRAAEILARLIVAAGLAVDAYVHVDVAGRYSHNPSGSLHQDKLFLIEAGVASFAALMVFISGHRAAYALAFMVAASALGGVLLYRYQNVGTLGPIPNMYEPLWYMKKTVSAIAEGAAAVAAAFGMGVAWSRRAVAVVSTDREP